MKSDKQVKKELKKKASKNPDKYYATSVLKGEGFKRKQCSSCSTYFWTVKNHQDVCGDPACSGGFRFIGTSPVQEKMDYVQTWKKFATLFKKLGYTPIKRYPVVARWREDQYWVGASIYDFQPHVVNGEVNPPANPLVVPQFCLRFNDIDNVGITGAHYTGFIMIGQHAFLPKEEWDQDKVFRDIHTWLKEGLGLPNDELTFHEDAWAGGGNSGPCMEYFSRGLELGNQVYMLYEQTSSGPRELPLKVLDMGMGHERNTWFSQGTSTSYESTFPTVCEKLKEITGVKTDDKLMRKFLPYASYLNIDEVDDIEKAWKRVAQAVGAKPDELKGKILPLSALYSIAEHSRTILFALNDGALPSNVGGGYNLRVILRRALSFIDHYRWKLTLPEICRWHAAYLEPLFPELVENLDDVEKILLHEREKFSATKKKSKKIIHKLLSKKKLSSEKLIEIYDSHGISPQMVAKQAASLGRKVDVPENFYAKVAERHSQASALKKREDKLDLESVQETKILYYQHYDNTEFDGIVLKIIGKFVILDKTIFYPTSGGQLHDEGTLGGKRVVNVFKQGKVIVHEFEKRPPFKKGEIVHGKIDFKRRLQLAQHHTATHILNLASKALLGNHIWQAGAHKALEKARLDITHYKALSDDEVRRIDNYANMIIDDNLPVYSSMMERNVAEAEYGFRIYQGGAVPGKTLRIVKIGEMDVEACGGTHLHTTGEVKLIKILRTTKIQDGIVRIEFTAGNAAALEEEKELEILRKAAGILDCDINQVPGRSKELFKKWKKVVKKKEVDAEENFTLTSIQQSSSDLLQATAHILRTQPDHIPKTLKRFREQLKKIKSKRK